MTGTTDGRRVERGARGVGRAGRGMLLTPEAMRRGEHKDSKHNLGTTGSATNTYQFSGTDEVCVFCHTPHGSDTSAAVPLWNRTLANPSSYTTYDQLGTSVARRQGRPVARSRSPACPATTAVSPSTPLSTPRAAARRVARPGRPARSAAASNKMQAGSIALLGTDFARPPDQHPVRRGGYSTATSHGRQPGADRTSPCRRNTVLAATTVWVDTSRTTGRARRPTMLLYTGRPRRYGARPIRNVRRVRDCHDPHQANNRRSCAFPYGSQLCLTCT